MSALDNHLMSLDETIRAVRNEYEGQIQRLKDQLTAANIENRLRAEAQAEAVAARASAERVTAALLAKFGLVSKVFEEAKALAEATLESIEHKVEGEVEGAIATGASFLHRLEHSLTKE